MTTNQKSSHTKEIINFDKEKFPFHKVIADLLESDKLDALSSENISGERTNSYYKNMEQTPLFKKMYENLEGEKGSRFYELYRLFIEKVIRPKYTESIYYQKKPSHRILFKDIEGEARFHKDSDYGHSHDEINYWLPQTAAFDSNSIWIEQNEGAGDYKSVNLKVGQCVQFNGAGLSHGAFPNSTGKTRVSFDFRVIPVSKMKENEHLKERERDNNPVMANALKFSFCE
ncbi:MAG: hypothetical protein WA951_03315 [Leeuwenhoekiella sp.]